MNTSARPVGFLSITAVACLLAFFMTTRAQAQNTATGTNALVSIKLSGSDNTADGANSLEGDTTGSLNTATGYSALSSNTSGIQNLGAGAYALYSNTTGYLNIALGYQALYYNTSGYQNSASGGLSLFSNTSGVGNTAAGAYSLFANTAGYLNTADGYGALYTNSTGYNNVAIGENAGLNLTTGSNNIEIGDYNLNTNTADDAAGEANTIRIGEASTQKAAYIAGIYGAVSTDPAATLVFVDRTGHLVTSSTATLNLQAGSLPGMDVTPASITGTQLASNLALGGTTTGIFSGDGSNLTGITVPASSVTGTISGSQLAAASVTGTQLASNLALAGTATGIFTGTFAGNGAGLSGVTVSASSVTGSLSGSQLGTGSVGSTQLASNLTLGGTTSGAFSGAFSGNGAALTGVGVAAVASNLAAGATAQGALTVTGPLFSDQSGPQEFALENKAPGSVSFAVPMLYPTTPNSVEAFDLMPNGTPVVSPSSPDYGQDSWMDVCDADCSADVTGTGVAFNSAHVGINGYYGYVDLGSYDYGGHPRLDLSLTMDGYQKLTVAGLTGYILFNPYGNRSLFEAVYPDQFVLGSTNTQIALDNGGSGSTPRLLTMNGPNTDNPLLTFRADSTTFSGGSGTSGVNIISIWNNPGPNANGLVITTATSGGCTLYAKTTGTGAGTSALRLAITATNGAQYNLLQMSSGSPTILATQPGTNPLYIYDASFADVICRITNTGEMILRPNSSTDTAAINSQGTSFFNGGNVAVGSTTTPYTLGVTGSLGVSGAIAPNTAQTSVAASTSGTATFSEPFQGASFKQVMIYLSSVTGTANYAFPTAFSHTPVVLSTSGLAPSTVTKLTSTNATVTGASSTGFLFVEGF
jgi:hypothetical protein